MKFLKRNYWRIHRDIFKERKILQIARLAVFSLSIFHTFSQMLNRTVNAWNYVLTNIDVTPICYHELCIFMRFLPRLLTDITLLTNALILKLLSFLLAIFSMWIIMGQYFPPERLARNKSTVTSVVVFLNKCQFPPLRGKS